MVADITTADYAPESFDVIYSRDTILHIADKESLFKNFLVCHFFCNEGVLKVKTHVILTQCLLCPVSQGNVKHFVEKLCAFVGEYKLSKGTHIFG